RRRRRSRLQAGRRVRRPDRGAAPPTAGPVRAREDRMSVLTSGEFWAFVGVVAGIYTLFTLGLQVQFGLAGLLNFGQVGFMAIGAYTMAILVAKEGWSMWVATPVAIAAAALAGVLGRSRPRGSRWGPRWLADASPPRRLLRDRHYRLQRDRALGGHERERADGRRTGDDQPRGPGHGGPVQRAVGAVPALGGGPVARRRQGRGHADPRLDRGGTSRLGSTTPHT